MLVYIYPSASKSLHKGRAGELLARALIVDSELLDVHHRGWVG